VIRSTLRKNSTSLFRNICLLLVILSIVSCGKKNLVEKPVDPGPDDTIPAPVSFKNGIFIVNEGNFNWGNASISFINASDYLVNQNVFQEANNRSLGDVAESMKVLNNKGFIVVNNSNTVEVVSLEDFKSIASIKGFNSPRNIEFIDSTKAYVTNMLGDISVVSLQTFTITKTIQIHDWTESLLKYDDYVFVTCVGSYNEPNSKRKSKIAIISTKDDRIIDSISTGKEPLAIVIDKKLKIWVLCTGGFDGYEAPTLLRLDPDLRMVEKEFAFVQGVDSPSRLCINPSGDTLYFLNNGVFQMPVNSSSLPSEPLIAPAGRLFYGLGISPNGNVFVSDAVDYVQNGWAYQFNQSTGALIKSYKAGRIPGYFCFTGTIRTTK
jgi:hypothetical protein